MFSAQYLPLAQQQLTQFAGRSDFAAKMTTAFGSKINRVQLAAIGQRWQQGNFAGLPAIEVLQQGELGAAKGAYAAAGNKIYLSASFLATASTADIVGVLLEEIGHSLDGLLNVSDAQGDEGALFSAFVQGDILSASEILGLKAEDDRATILLNGQLIAVEQSTVTGDNNNNTLNGTALADSISGLNGDDTISGLGGNDKISGGYGSDSMTGGAGSDIFALESFIGSTYVQDFDVVTDFLQGQDKVDLRGLGIGSLDAVLAITNNDFSNNAIITTYYNNIGGSYSLKLDGIDRGFLATTDFIFNTAVVNDNKIGTSYSDDLFGGQGNDTLNGGTGGDDRLFGEQGNDSLAGGYGSDMLYGGAGSDIFALESFNGSTYIQDKDIAADFLQGYDRVDLRGLGIGDFNTLLAITSNDFSNTAIITTYYNNIGGSYSLKLDGIDRGLLTASNFIFSASVLNDSKTGTSYSDDLFGGQGNDTLRGGTGGDDRLFGEQGNDSLSGGYGSDLLTGGSGLDTFALEYFNASTYIQDVDVVTDFVRGQDKIDVRSLGIGDFSTILALTSNDANGDAVITTYYNNIGGSYNLKLTGIDRGLLAASNFVFNANVLNDSKVGTSYSDDLFGGQGNDTLNGGTGGDDRLFGEQGNDILVGGYGSDTLYGGLGNDSFALEYSNGSTYLQNQDVVADFVRGQDKIDVRSLGISDFNTILALTSNDATGSAVITTHYNNIGGSYSLQLKGINRNLLLGANFIFNTNLISEAKAGTNYDDDLFGGLGNDTLTGGSGNDRLFGEQGVDRLIGGTGDDIYYVENAGDLVVESSAIASEIDRVSSSVSYALGINVENLTLTGAAASGTGNGLNNFITGNAVSNVLSGGLGNDTLDGSFGLDVMTGGAGVDTFVLHKAQGVDRISDFVAGERLLLSAAEFGGGLVYNYYNPTLTASQVRVGAGITTANSASQRLIFDSLNRNLYFDADGNGAGAAVQIAKLTGTAAISNLSFSIGI
jgi:Ca2+-binding RTX toxin-like protein